MRGQVISMTYRYRRARITPADAGTSMEGHDIQSTGKDHPRGCGDKEHPELLHIPPAGSPPRMRGQVFAVSSRSRGRWITPADAGTSKLLLAGQPGCGDHPRGCGDKKTARRMSRILRGSPPRMRGQDLTCIKAHLGARITPADAGTRWDEQGGDGLHQDHPRGCGDKPFALTIVTASAGSPPRMRGQVWL